MHADAVPDSRSGKISKVAGKGMTDAEDEELERSARGCTQLTHTHPTSPTPNVQHGVVVVSKLLNASGT